jgi:SAM-dependent methyltransferase
VTAVKGFVMGFLGRVHDSYVVGRRTRILTRWLSDQIPPHARVLDVGCGDGRIAKLLLEIRRDIQIEGIDVLERPVTHIPVGPFDGLRIPFREKSFDAVMFIDVLHHADDPEALLREARRVALRAVIVKDHCREGWLAGPTLRFMDWFGNARHGVALPYNYWPGSRWRDAFARLGLLTESWNSRLELYRWPFSIAFDRKLQFIARLTPAS